jgi:hypothetical protein
MSWFNRILDAVQTAAIIGERVEKLGAATAELARDLRETEKRVARLEGYAYGRGAAGAQPPKLPRPKS